MSRDRFGTLPDGRPVTRATISGHGLTASIITLGASLQDLPADARIISRAVPPNEAYFPRKAPIVIIATLAVFVLSVAFVAASEIFSGRALIRAPMRIACTSPRATAPGHREASSSSSTLPMTVAAGSM